MSQAVVGAQQLPALAAGSLQATGRAVKTGAQLQQVLKKLQACLQAGQVAHASALVDKLVQLWPDSAATESARGALAFSQKNFSEAVLAFRRAIALQQAAGQIASVGSLLNLAGALDDLGEQAYKAESQSLYRQVLAHPSAALPAHQGAYLAALTQLSALLTAQGMFDEALDLRRQAVLAAPDQAYPYYAMACTLLACSGMVQALPWLDAAIDRDPALAEAHFTKAACTLRAGDFAAGWDRFEWRWKIPQAAGCWPLFTGALWQGEPLEQRILLVWGEQGLGDNVQFLRHLADLRQRWPEAGLVFWCPQTLLPLVASFAQHHQVVLLPREKALPSRVQGHDTHVPLMSLPRLLGLRLQDERNWHWPAQYLRPPPERVSRWGALLGNHYPRVPGRLRVGLVWSGAKAFIHAARRNTSLHELTPWLNQPELDWVSLQLGEATAELPGSPWAGRLLDLTPQIVDFADTAALAMQLDLVLSVDTATAHVAAAAGIPVWLLSRFDGCWRWLQDRADNPWYPTVRVFRQPRPLDWAPVVADVAKALVVFAASPAQRCGTTQTNNLDNTHA